MTGKQLAKHRAAFERTQEQMAALLGCSVVGYKRFETGARPIPAYMAHSVKAFALCEVNGLLPALEKALRKP